MDNAQIEQELEDLEGRLERLRALYEQYFMGLEKLEPTVLRKDVDRKLWVLRREQIRNTGLRFKFQMLIQRYNTYQQYWTRIVREIENGTYRRDILKVAQRFGEKDALTILGKKRAEQYKRLAKNQIERRSRWKGEEDKKLSEAPPAVEAEEISLDTDEYELIEDEVEEEVTLRKDLPPVREPHEHGEPDMESLLMFATVGVKEWTAPRTEAAKPEASKGEASKAEASKHEAPRAEAPKPEAPRAEAPKIEAPKPGATSPAAKSRVAELAAQMRAKREAAKAKTDTLDLDHLLDAPPGAALARPPARPAQPVSSAEAPRPPASPAVPANPTFKPHTPSASATTTPLPRPAPAAPASPFPRPASATSLPGGKSTGTAQPKPSPAAAPKPVLDSAPKPASPREDLSDQKMREIYVKYVGAKRAANESTAGITYDKLAQSLRAQVQKLRTTHPTRTIDFEVVTKDGKTALRPIVK